MVVVLSDRKNAGGGRVETDEHLGLRATFALGTDLAGKVN